MNSKPNSSRMIWLAIRMTGARLRLASNMPLMKCRLPGPQLPATAVRRSATCASARAASLFVSHQHPLDFAFFERAGDQVERVAHHAVTMLDACILQSFNNDVRNQSAHC